MKNILTTCNRGGLCSFIIAIQENSNGDYEIITNGYADVKQILREIYYSIDNGEQLYISVVTTDENGKQLCEKLENASVDLTDGLQIKSNSLVISLNGEEIEIEENQGGSEVDESRLLPDSGDIYAGDVLAMYAGRGTDLYYGYDYTFKSTLSLNDLKEVLGAKFRTGQSFSGQVYFGKKEFDLDFSYDDETGELEYAELYYYPDLDGAGYYYYDFVENLWYEGDESGSSECEELPTVNISEEEWDDSWCDNGCFTDVTQVGVVFEDVELNVDLNNLVPAWVPSNSSGENSFTVVTLIDNGNKGSDVSLPENINGQALYNYCAEQVDKETQQMPYFQVIDNYFMTVGELRVIPKYISLKEGQEFILFDIQEYSEEATTYTYKLDSEGIWAPNN